MNLAPALTRILTWTLATSLLAASLVSASPPQGASRTDPPTNTQAAAMLPPGPPVRNLINARMPMRDGVELAADVTLPREPGRYPAVLIRTPYVRTTPNPPIPGFKDMASLLAGHGYAVVFQDVRGRGDSDGRFGYYHQEGPDGYDSVEWIARQSWSNGRVCMMGLSYLGAVQWLAARERPPHLVCIAPTASPTQWFDEVGYVGGIVSWPDWVLGVTGRTTQFAGRIDWYPAVMHRPLSAMPEKLGVQLPLWTEWLQHDTYDAYWKALTLSPGDFRALDLPALHVTGWFDADQPGSLLAWAGMQAHSPAADRQFLVIGPWNHVQTFFGGATRVGEMEFGADSVIDPMSLHLAFFDRYLRESGTPFEQPRARVYITGANEWRDYAQYPPANTRRKALYLGPGEGRHGSLGWSRPATETGARYRFDPLDPTPMAPVELAASRAFDGADYRALGDRSDVLTYTGEPLTEALEIIGEVTVELHFRSDAPDTDFVARLFDVYPDGRMVRLGVVNGGVRRARFREGYEQEKLLKPGEAARMEISLRHIGHRFLPGHRVALQVASGNFPMTLPNQGTGKPVASDIEWRVQNQTVLQGGKRASAILLPVIDTSGGHP